MSILKRPTLPFTPSLIRARPPVELCEETDEALQALFDAIVKKEKRGAKVMGPHGRVAVVNELRRRRDHPHLRRPR